MSQIMAHGRLSKKRRGYRFNPAAFQGFRARLRLSARKFAEPIGHTGLHGAPWEG
jgi:hypothetical protein